MSKEEGYEEANQGEATVNGIGPTEKIRNRHLVDDDLSVPGAQDPDSEIREETNPNTE